MLEISAGGFEFTARLEEDDAPQTVAAFRRLLPLESRIIHVRWSGEGGWIPFGDLDLGLGPENATCYPNPGEIVLYPGGVSETETPPLWLRTKSIALSTPAAARIPASWPAPDGSSTSGRPRLSSSALSTARTGSAIATGSTR